MTALVLHENQTVGEHRQTAVRWARRALHPGVALIVGMETTTPEDGSLTGKVGYSNPLNIGSLKTASMTGSYGRQQFRSMRRSKRLTTCVPSDA